MARAEFILTMNGNDYEYSTEIDFTPQKGMLIHPGCGPLCVITSAYYRLDEHWWSILLRPHPDKKYDLASERKDLVENGWKNQGAS